MDVAKILHASFKNVTIFRPLSYSMLICIYQIKIYLIMKLFYVCRNLNLSFCLSIKWHCHQQFVFCCGVIS